jgi:hypothetical protein
MTEHEIRVALHGMLNAHDDALNAIRVARTKAAEATSAVDDAIVSAIDANRAALQMLNRVMNEGIQPDV